MSNRRQDEVSPLARPDTDVKATGDMAHDGPGQGGASALGSAVLQRKLARRRSQAADREPGEADLASAVSWATTKGGPGVEAVRSIQETLGAEKTGIYDTDTARAVFKKQGGLHQSQDGKAGAAFCQSVGVIFTQTIEAAAVKDEEVKYLKESCKDGISVAIYTKFDTAKTGAGDLEFVRKADEYAKRYHAVGLNGASVAIGKSSPLTELSQLVSIVQAIHKGLAAKAHAAAPAEGATPGKDAGKDAAWTRVKHLAIFTHGLEYGLATDPSKHTFRNGLHKDSAGLAPSNIKSFVSGLSGAITKDVGVALFACSTGHDMNGSDNDGTGLPKEGEKKADASFAGALAKELHAQGADKSNVYGHTVAAHTTENYAARDFSGGGGLHMFDVLYTDAVIQGKCAKYVPDFAAKSEADQKPFLDKMRTQMFAQYKDTIQGELMRANKGQKGRFKIDMGMEMFQDPARARTLMLEDFDSFWMQQQAHLDAVVKGAHVAPVKPAAAPVVTHAAEPKGADSHPVDAPPVKKTEPVAPHPVEQAKPSQGVTAPAQAVEPAATHGIQQAPGQHLKASVGQGGTNDKEDVHAAQTALVATGFSPGHVDHEFGPQTLLAITGFQESIGLTPDGLVEPGKTTEKHLFHGAPPAQATPVTHPFTAIAKSVTPAPAVQGSPTSTATAAPVTTTAAPATTTQAPVTTPAGTTPAATDGNGLGTIQETADHRTEKMLRPDEIFADTLRNNDTKKHAFQHLNRAWSAVRAAEGKVGAAKDAKAKEAADKALAAARADVVTATSEVQSFIVKVKLDSDKPLAALKEQLKDALKHKDKARAAEVKTALDAYLKTRTAELTSEVAAMKHKDPGHQDESVFAPVDSDVTTHHYTFDDGQSVTLRDHAVSYATTSMTGVDTDISQTKQEKSDARAAVQKRMGDAGISGSNEKILKMISGFEGGFDSVNTYDRAVLTFGFVQWTGGNASDLTQALAQIKAKQPDAWKTQFQRYGIDIVGDKLRVTTGDGKVLEGDAAAAAVQKDAKLAAVFAHAGKDEGIQKGEVQAGVAIEITRALDSKVKVGPKSTVALSHIMRSEYGVGLLANTYVHSGSGAAHNVASSAVSGVLESNPYSDKDEWAKLAEKAIIDGLAARDGDRAKEMGKKLDQTWGSYKA